MNTQISSTFGKRLAEALDGKGYSVSYFAKIIGYSKQSISAYINETRSPKRPVIILLAKTLNVNEAWLMGYDVARERAV